MRRVLTIILLIVTLSCESLEDPPIVKDEDAPVVYTPTDFDDVNGAYDTLVDNFQGAKDTAVHGRARAKAAHPLITKLIAVHDFDQELTKSDVAMFRAELPDWYSIFTAEEVTQFNRYAATNYLALEQLKGEADKGVNHDKVMKVKDTVIATLTAEIAERENYIRQETIKVLKLYSGICFGIGITALVLGGLAKVWMPALTKPAWTVSSVLMGCGTALLSIGHALDWVQTILEEHGKELAASVLIPVLLRWAWITFMKTRVQSAKLEEELEDIQKD